jgi:hypothetical protein
MTGSHCIKFVFLSFFQCVMGCASGSRVSFKSDLDATLTLVSFDNPQGAGKRIGNTPLTLPMSALRAGPLRIQSPGLPEQYWVFTDPKETSLEIDLHLANGRTTDNSCSVDTLNQQARLILMAYEALTRSDVKTALQLAEQLSSMSPGVAAAHILSGIAFMQSKQNDKATAAFTRAKALDPADKNIERLLQAVKK